MLRGFWSSKLCLLDLNFFIFGYLRMNDRYSNWLREIDPAYFVFVLLVATYVVTAPLVLLQFFVPSLKQPLQDPTFLQSFGLLGRFLLGSIIVPLVETASLQWFPIFLLRDKLGFHWILVIVLSATLFAQCHSYSTYYMIYAFMIGLVLAYGYAVLQETRGRAFLLICLVHGLRNGITSFTS